MAETREVPRSLVWTPVIWLMAGEAVLFALLVPVAVALHIMFASTAAEALEESAGLVAWTVAGSMLYSALMVAGVHALGMHSVRSREHGMHTLLKYLLGAAAGAMLLWLFIQFAPGIDVNPLTVTGVTAAGMAGLVVWRGVVGGFIDSAAVRINVLVLGAGKRAEAFDAGLRRRSDRRGLNVVGYLPLDEGEVRLRPGKVMYSRASLASICERNRIDEIVIAVDDRRAKLPLEQLLECRFRGVSVSQAASFIERECGRIPLELVDPGWWLFRGGFSDTLPRRVLKRLFDLFAGSLILLLALPLMLCCALAIKLEEGWRARVFYRQHRVGQHGRIFLLTKFRSMREDAEGDGKARWATVDDDRVTRTGKWLRKLRLDELPQLFNVIKGEMSLVGPRPERPEFVSELAKEIPYYERRHAVHPGITGWAQLCYPYGASVRDAAEKLKYDLYYIKNYSLLLDITILLRTVEVVLFGKGAR